MKLTGSMRFDKLSSQHLCVLSIQRNTHACGRGITSLPVAGCMQDTGNRWPGSQKLRLESRCNGMARAHLQGRGKCAPPATNNTAQTDCSLIVNVCTCSLGAWKSSLQAKGFPS